MSRTLSLIRALSIQTGLRAALALLIALVLAACATPCDATRAPPDADDDPLWLDDYDDGYPFID